IRIPGGRYSQQARYLKVRDRASYEFALVAIAAALDMDGDVVREVRLAAGGVGTRPWRLRACEVALRGQRLDRPVLESIAQLATEGTRPLRHNGYKVELLPRTIVRALEMAGDIA